MSRSATGIPAVLRAWLNSRVATGMRGDFRSSLVDMPGEGVYPLTYLCYALVHRHLRALPQTDLATRKAIKVYLLWTIDSRGGQAIVEQIEFVAVAPPFDDLSHGFIPARPSHGFIPMPDALRAAIYQCVASIVV